MDVVILFLTGKFLRKQIFMGRLLTAAVIGGVWACVSVGMRWAHVVLRIMLWWMDWLIIPICMVRVTYPDRQFRELLRGYLYLFLAAILLGGVIHVIWENTQLGYFWKVWMAGSDIEAISVWLLALAMLGGTVVIELGHRYQIASSQREQIQEVVLYTQYRQWSVKALWDSGNQLYDPCSGKAIHIVEVKEIKQLLDDEAYEYVMGYMEQGVTVADSWDRSSKDSSEKLSDNSLVMHAEPQAATLSALPQVRLIPCRSLGSAHSLLPVISITKIRLADGSILVKPLIGLSSISLSEDGSYGMLLHSQTDEMRRNQ